MQYGFNMMLLRRFIIPSILLLFQTGLSNGQMNNAVFDNLLTEFETHSLYVNAITQDNHGFIWIGTFEGLIRFDGIDYQTYLPSTGNERSISDKLINTIFNDSEGNLWIGTRNGLNRYSYLTNDFEHFFSRQDDQNSLSNNEINTIAEDADKNLWIGTLNGGLTKMIRVSEAGKESYRFTRCTNDPHNASSISGNTVYSIVFDANGNGWVGTSEGLNFIERKNASSKNISFLQVKNNPSDPSSITGGDVFKIFCDPQNNIWLISNRGMLDRLSASDIASGNFHFLHLLPAVKRETGGTFNSTTVFLVDHQNYCWLGTFEDGLYRFKFSQDFRVENATHYNNNPASNRTLPDNGCWSICEISDHTIWVGTASGVSRWNPLQENFSVVNGKNSDFDLTGVNAVSEDQNMVVWLSNTSDTLFAIDRKSGTIKKAVLKDKSRKPDYKLYINTLLVSRTGDVFAGTSVGVFILENSELKKFRSLSNYVPAARQLRYVEDDTASLISNTINCMAEDSHGNIWIGTGMGLNFYQPATAACRRVLWNKSSRDIIPSYIIRHLEISSDGNVWAGTDEGLFKINPSTYHATSFGKENGLPVNRLSFIHESKDHQTLWLGTGQGLVSFQLSTQRFRSYSLQQGRDFNIMAILEDDHGNLWIGTDHGIVKWNLQSNDTRIFTSKNGLNTNRFNPAACYADDNGLFFFGGERGFQSFYPDSIYTNTITPPVVLTDFKLFNQSILNGKNAGLANEFLQQKKLDLKYNQNFFSIDFAALNYINSEANSYSYQLVGIDKDWVNAGNSRTATYTNIPPGTYEFKVRGSNNDGVWNKEGASIFIRITPPWWKTWWFYALCVIAFVAALYGLYRYRFNQIKKLFAIRSKIARDLHDDIGSTLSSISLMSQLAKDGTGSTDKEQELFETISTASREAMELMSVIVWSVNPNNDKLSNILIRMREYASDILEASNIDLKITLEEDVKDLIIPMEKRKDFYLIFKEAVNNVAKYSKAATANIRLFREHGKMVMTIEDDGKGFEVGKLRSGNGLVNMKERAKFIGGILDLQSQPGRGTSVRLEMPVVS